MNKTVCSINAIPTPTPAEARDALVRYLLVKLAGGDWHGVRDAAADLEVLETRHPELWNTARGS